MGGTQLLRVHDRERGADAVEAQHEERGRGVEDPVEEERAVVVAAAVQVHRHRVHLRKFEFALTSINPEILEIDF